MGEMEEPVGEYARRLPDAWAPLMELLPGLRDGQRGLALYALEAAARDDAGRRELLRESLGALGDSGPAAVAAAVLGRNGRGVPGVWEELCGVLDRDAADPLRGQAVVALVNLHGSGGDSLGPALRTLLEREVAQETGASGVAALFLRRSTRRLVRRL